MELSLSPDLAFSWSRLIVRISPHARISFILRLAVEDLTTCDGMRNVGDTSFAGVRLLDFKELLVMIVCSDMININRVW